MGNKRFISTILAIALIIGIIPTNAFAKQDNMYSIENVFEEFENSADTDVYYEDLAEFENSYNDNTYDNTQTQASEETPKTNVDLDVSTMSVMPITSYVAQNTDDSTITYTSLQDAIDNSSSIKLLADVELTVALSISKEITIDLNGFDIQQTVTGQRVIYIDSSGNLTLKDSDTSRTRYGYWDNDDTYKITADGESVPSVTDYTTLKGGIIYGGSATNAPGSGVNVTGGSFTMDGGNIAGNTASTYGGGVYLSSKSGTFTMNDGTIIDNISTSIGGGVYIKDGTFTMNGGTIRYNEASYGGGVCVDGTFIMNDGSTIEENKATNGGGGVYFSNGTFTMNNGSTIKSNETTNGGGVYLVFGTFTMNNGSTIEENKATYGGGVYIYFSGTLTMRDGSTIEKNEANYGGGVYIDYGSFTMDTGTISGNKANFGGGVYVDASTTFTMNDGTISNNEASYYGGGVYVNNHSFSSATFTMNGGTIKDNTAQTGNRIYLSGTNSIFNLKVSEDDTATIKGALYTNDDDNYNMTVHSGCTVTIDDENTDSKSRNEIVYFTGETWTFDQPVAELNETIYFTLEEAIVYATTEDNDTITLLADVELEDELSISKKITIDLNGFDIKQTGEANVISVTSDGNFTLKDSNPNSRTRYGYWDNDDTYKIIADKNSVPSVTDYTTLTGGIIYGGSANIGGGGVYVISNGTFTMDGGNIAGNKSTTNGGGGVYASGTFTMNGGKIAGNTSSSYSGGVYVSATGAFTMDGSTIENNTATNGGGICVNQGTFTMDGGNIKGNDASSFGGGVYISGGTITINNDSSIIEGNTAKTGNRMYLYGTNYSTDSIFNLKVSDDVTATINGNLYTNDDDNYNMTVYSSNSVKIGSDDAVSKTKGDIAYFTGTTWTFDPPVAEINGTRYFALEAAVTNASSTDTITLLADVELEEALSIEKQVTIDLNGFDIKQTGEYSVISITSNGNLTLEDSNPNNRTRYGYWDNDGTYQITDTQDDDYTELKGGVIYGGVGKDSNPYTYGGGVYIDSGTFTMTGGTIAGNKVTFYGGGVFVVGGTFTMNSGTITDNITEEHGGGIYVAEGTFTMDGTSTISNNTAIDGGGVYVDTTGTFTMNGGTIEFNETTSNAGGVFVNTATFTMNDGTIENNTANTNGGGVYVSNATFTMNDGTIENNTAKTTGNRIYLSGLSATFKLYISPERTSSIAGPVYTNDDDNFDMIVYSSNSVKIGSDDAVSKTNGDIAYFTGTTWTFDQPSIDFSSIITQPVTGSALQTATTVTDSNGTTHNVTVSWSPSHTIAQADTAYTATIVFDDDTLEIYHEVSHTDAGIKVDSQVVTLVFQATEKDTSDLVSILGAKFYSGQLWDTQRSPAYPNTSSTFRLFGLSAPYDHYLSKFDMSNGEYVKFELIEVNGTVQTLEDLDDQNLIDRFNSYSNSSASADGVLVREVLYNANGTEKQVLSDYGLIWALDDEGFLYTAFSGYLKYSGGVGTYVTIDARNSNDTIVYIPDSNDPLSEQDIDEGKDVVATEDGDNSTPSETIFDLYGKVVDTNGDEVPNATVTITYDEFTYTTTTDSNGYFIIPSLVDTEDDYTATVQTSSGELNTYSGTLADKSDAIVLKYDSTKAGESDVLDLYTVTIDLGSSTAYSVPSGTMSVIPGESLTVIFGNEVDGYVLDTVNGVTNSNIYEFTPTGTTTLTATWKKTTITNVDLTNYVTAPIKNGVPDTTDIDDDQYTGTISWDASDSAFSGNTVYTATVTLTAKDGYTLDGISSNSFSYTNATVTNNANSGEITIVFPSTSDKTVSSIEVTTNPTKVEYEYGDTIDLTGLVVNVTYDDNSNADITDYTVSPETFTDIGTVTITVTKDGKTTTFDVTVSKKTLTITDAKATDREYDGTTTVDVTGSALSGVYGTDDVTISATTGASASADAGTHSVTGVNFVLSGSDKDNYTLTQPTDLTVTISKATYTDITNEGSSKYGSSNSVDLSDWYSLDGANLVLSTITDNDSILDDSVTLNNSTQSLNFSFVNDSTLADKTATVLITVSSTNYENFTLTITLTVLNKLSPNVTVDDFTKTYDGTAITIDDLTKSADVDGEWSLSDNPVNASTDTYTVIFTPTNTEDYNIFSQDITIEITKASIDNVILVGLDSSYTETGSEIIPEFTVTDNYGNILTENDDYTIEITNNISVGTAIITIIGTGNGNYDSEAKEFTFSIVKKSTTSNGGSVTTHPVTVEKDDETGDISISPTNPQQGQTVIITPKPNEGYELSTLVVVDALGDLLEVTENDDGTYSFVQGANKVTITANFEEIDNFVFPFTDVPESIYYYEAILWAVENNIALGKTETLFFPEDINTRAEVVTFLWRISGSPIVDCENPFEDVLEGTYYYDAILWAVENNIALGTSETTFDPNETCDRSQAVTFLYRYVGEPEVTSVYYFEDVPEYMYYYNPISWAFENEVTLGTGDNTFSPTQKISRGQFVTFLFRFFSKK